MCTKKSLNDVYQEITERCVPRKIGKRLFQDSMENIQDRSCHRPVGNKNLQTRATTTAAVLLLQKTRVSLLTQTQRQSYHSCCHPQNKETDCASQEQCSPLAQPTSRSFRCQWHQTSHWHSHARPSTHPKNYA